MKSAMKRKCVTYSYMCTTKNYLPTNLGKYERASLISRCRDLHDENTSHLNSDLSVVIGLIRKLYQCTNPETTTLRSLVIGIARLKIIKKMNSFLVYQSQIDFRCNRSIRIKILSQQSIFFFITVRSMLALYLYESEKKASSSRILSTVEQFISRRACNSMQRISRGD